VRLPVTCLRVVLPFALALMGGTCNSSVQPQEPVPDARGCSDWPKRPGERFISLHGASKFEVEPFFVARQGDLAIAWEACGCDDLTRIGYTRRGQAAEFDESRYLASPNGQMASNVSLAQDGAGSLYAAWASWTPGPDPAQPHVLVSDIHIQFARWPAGAVGFEGPVELSEPIPDSLYDKPWMIVTSDDVIIVSYSDLRRGGILAVSSKDRGASFQRAIVDSTTANLSALCSDGRPGGAFVTYIANRTLRMAHTTDSGATWSAPVAAAVADPSGDVAYQDPTCIANGDEVWISYGRTHMGGGGPVEPLVGVHVAHMTLGAEVSDRDVVALDGNAQASFDGGTGAGFLLFPQLARNADGTLGLAVYRASGEGTGMADVVVVVSPDGGRSFESPIILATGLTPSLQRHVPDWLGDYFGWGSTAAGLGAAFIDNASGFSHIVFNESVLSSPVQGRAGR